MVTKLLTALRLAAAAAVIVLAALLAYQCADLYLTGTEIQAAQPDHAVYRREDVAARLQSMLLPVIGCAAVIAAAAAVQSLCGRERMRHALTPANRLRLMKRRAGALPAEAQREERFRRLVRGCSAAALALCAAGMLCGLLWLMADTLADPQIALRDLEADLMHVLLFVLPGTAAAIGIIWLSAALLDRSRLRECALLQGVRAGQEIPVTAPAQERGCASAGRIRLVLYGCAALFIVLGAMSGGARETFDKAIALCLECIGIG